MRRRTAGSATGAPGAWTYSETIDEAHAAIRVRGKVDSLGVDLLRGTVEELDRRGHEIITVTIDGPGSVDPTSGAVLDALARELAAHDHRLTIMWAAAQEEGAADLHGGAGGQRVDGSRSGGTAGTGDGHPAPR